MMRQTSGTHGRARAPRFHSPANPLLRESSGAGDLDGGVQKPSSDHLHLSSNLDMMGWFLQHCLGCTYSPSINN